MPTEERNLVKVACDACGAKYSLPEDRLKGRVLKIRCKACSQVFEVRDDGVTSSTPSSALANRGQKRWFAVIDRERVGPMTEQDLRDRHGRREVTLRSYVWRQGMGEWKRLFEVEDFSDLEEHEVASDSAPRSATMKLVRLGAGAESGARPIAKSPSGATIGGAAATISKVEGLAPEATRVVAYLPTKEQGDDRVRAVYVRGEEDTLPAPSALSGPSGNEAGLTGQATVEYPEHFARARDAASGQSEAAQDAAEDDDEGPTTRLDVEDAGRLRAAIEAARQTPPRDPAVGRQTPDAVPSDEQLAGKLLEASATVPGVPDNATAQSLSALAEAGEKNEAAGDDTAGEAEHATTSAEDDAAAAERAAVERAAAESDTAIMPDEPSVEVASPDDLFGSSPAVDQAPKASSGKGPVRLAGQRAEDSVLFSLDNLSRDQRHRLTGPDEPDGAAEATDDEEVSAASAVEAPPASAILTRPEEPVRGGGGALRFAAGAVLGAVLLAGIFYFVNPKAFKQFFSGSGSGSGTTAKAAVDAGVAPRADLTKVAVAAPRADAASQAATTPDAAAPQRDVAAPKPDVAAPKPIEPKPAVVPPKPVEPKPKPVEPKPKPVVRPKPKPVVKPKPKPVVKLPVEPKPKPVVKLPVEPKPKPVVKLPVEPKPKPVEPKPKPMVKPKWADPVKPKPVEPKPVEPPKPALPPKLSAAQVKAGFAKVRPAVKAACGKLGGGFLTVEAAINGATGRVARAKVLGSFVDAPLAACVTSTLKAKARFPKFSEPAMTVKSPLLL